MERVAQLDEHAWERRVIAVLHGHADGGEPGQREVEPSRLTIGNERERQRVGEVRGIVRIESANGERSIQRNAPQVEMAGVIGGERPVGEEPRRLPQIDLGMEGRSAVRECQRAGHRALGDRDRDRQGLTAGQRPGGLTEQRAVEVVGIDRLGRERARRHVLRQQMTGRVGPAESEEEGAARRLLHLDGRVRNRSARRCADHDVEAPETDERQVLGRRLVLNDGDEGRRLHAGGRLARVQAERSDRHIEEDELPRAVSRGRPRQRELRRVLHEDDNAGHRTAVAAGQRAADRPGRLDGDVGRRRGASDDRRRLRAGERRPLRMRDERRERHGTRHQTGDDVGAVARDRHREGRRSSHDPHRAAGHHVAGVAPHAPSHITGIGEGDVQHGRALACDKAALRDRRVEAGLRMSRHERELIDRDQGRTEIGNEGGERKGAVGIGQRDLDPPEFRRRTLESHGGERHRRHAVVFEQLTVRPCPRAMAAVPRSRRRRPGRRSS